MLIGVLEFYSTFADTLFAKVFHLQYYICVFLKIILVVAYLIFVISFTQAGFFNSKVVHPKTTQNTHKLQQIPKKM